MVSHEWALGDYTSRIWTSHATNVIAACHIYKWVMSRIRLTQVTNTTGGVRKVQGDRRQDRLGDWDRQDCEGATWLTHMGGVNKYHDSFLCEAYLICMCDMSHSRVCDTTHPCVWYHPSTCGTWLIHMGDMTHPHGGHDWLVYVKRLIHECVTWLIYVWDVRDSFECVTWRIHMCDMTHLYAWHDPFVRVTWPIHVCDMTHSCVWHDPFKCVTWLIRMRDMTHSYVGRGLFAEHYLDAHADRRSGFAPKDD